MIYFPNQNAIDVSVDGSCQPTNPGPAGIGICIEYPEHLERDTDDISISYKRSTSNRMELIACIEALKYIRKKELQKIAKPVRLFSDSEYVCNHLKIAEIYWSKQWWKNKDGRTILNRDLWEELLRIWKIIPISPQWVRRRSTRGLRIADHLAKSASRSIISLKIDYGLREGNASRSRAPGGPTILFPANLQEEVIYIYYWRGPNEDILYEIRFHIFNQDENIYEGKYIAYCTSEQKGNLHRNHFYSVVFNSTPPDPRFTKIEDWVDD